MIPESQSTCGKLVGWIHGAVKLVVLNLHYCDCEAGCTVTSKVSWFISSMSGLDL